MNKLKMILPMLIFGTLGVFVHFIDLPIQMLAALRAIIGSLFLAFFMIIRRNKINTQDIKGDLKLLIPSGIVLGFMWIFLFQAYKLSTVAIATLCHYMAPVLVMLLSPIFFKEKLTGLKMLCIAAAVAGIVLVSGLTGGSSVHLSGVLMGLLSACFYASVIIMNKFIRNLPPAETTFLPTVYSCRYFKSLFFDNGKFFFAGLNGKNNSYRPDYRNCTYWNNLSAFFQRSRRTACSDNGGFKLYRSHHGGIIIHLISSSEYESCPMGRSGIDTGFHPCL